MQSICVDDFRVIRYPRKYQRQFKTAILAQELQELDTAMFSRAPPEAMGQTLTYFDSVYGGIRRYLEGIGFTREMQDRLARSLSP